MVLAMRLLGRPTHEIETALSAVRANRSAFRNSPGIAFSSDTLETIDGRWLDEDTVEAPIPEQVASRLRGRRFANSGEFRRAFWIAVSQSDLARQFTARDLWRMRRGLAPIAPRSQWYGRQRAYIVHHRRTIASGGAVYDMSNMLIVTPDRHQDILPPRDHFTNPDRQRRRER